MRIVLITLILSIFGFQAQAQKADPAIRAKVLAARAEAIQVIREYSENADYDAEMRKTAGLMADLLEKAAIAPAGGDILKYCDENRGIVADTDWISQLISMCRFGLSLGHNDLVQTFIHEAYHLYEWKYYISRQYTGYYKKVLNDPREKLNRPDILEESEKIASTIELQIMKAKYGCVFSITTYFEDLLGLADGIDFVICNKLHFKKVPVVFLGEHCVPRKTTGTFLDNQQTRREVSIPPQVNLCFLCNIVFVKSLGGWGLKSVTFGV